MSVEEFRDNKEEKLDSEPRVIDSDRPTSSDENTITFYGLILLKSVGMLLLFLLIKNLFQFLLGSRISDYTDNYWAFICAGLIPACIAGIKGENFWAWWCIGSYCPIISIVMAICCECSEETKVIGKGQESVE